MNQTLHWVKALAALWLVAVPLILASGCTSFGAGELNQNAGDQIVERLKLGMTNAEVDAAILNLKKWIEYDRSGLEIDSESRILQMYTEEHFPKDILKSIEVGTRCRALSYWSNYAGRQMQGVVLFFDEQTHRLRGWVNYPSASSSDKFLHERLTSRLALSTDYLKRMKRPDVYARIGLPTRVVAPPKVVSRETLEDHYWQSDSGTAPTLGLTDQIDVYEYRTKNGSNRHVYIAYTRANDRLIAFGYDHAWEEAERYLREKGAKKD
jgi:hypothetical protein